MNRIILFFVFVLGSLASLSQSISYRSNGVVTVSDARLQAQYNLFLPRYTDTTQANLQKGIDSCGAIIYTYDNVIWQRSCNPKRWTQINGGGGAGNPWNLTGNSDAIAGTSFLGTTNNIPLEFRINNKKSGYIDSVYRVTSLGYGSLRDLTPSGNTIGNHNVSIGYKSMNKDTAGYQNTSLGSQSMLNSSGSIGNISLGYGAMGLSRKVNYNVGIGWGALSKNYYGYYNTAIGHNSAGNLVPLVGDTLKYNTFIGAFSGYNQRGGANNVMIGDSAGLNNQSGNRNVFIGSKAGLNETGSDKLYIANSSTSSPLIKGDFSTKKVNISDYLLIGSATQPADSTLDVKGGVRLQSLYSSNEASDSMLVVKSNGGVALRTAPDNYWTKIADTIYSNNAGYVGIGTTSPDYKLDVNGIIGTNNGVNIAANGAKTGFYSNGNRLDIWAGNNKIAEIGLASANQNLYNFNYSIQPGTGTSGNQNSLNLSSNVTAGGLGTNSVNVAQLNIAPSYNQAPISGALGTGTLRGIYYHPTVASLNTSPHYAIETTSGELKFANISTSSDSSTYKPMGMNSSGDVVKMDNWITGSGGGGSGTVTSVATGYGLSGGTITTSGTLLVDTATLSTKYVRVSDYDTIYTTSPIMTMQSGDSTIIYFNTDTANAWRNSSIAANDTATVVKMFVHNAESTTLQRGEVVYLFGSNGNRASVKRANNKQDATSANTLGFVREDIAAGDTGWITTQGQIGKLNLGSYTAGQIVYLDSISGQLTVSKPSAPYHLVYLGVIERANNGNGLIYVKPQNGYELDEIHDVKITSKTNNDVLAYESSTNLWKNKQISTVLGYTPIAPADTSVFERKNTAAYTFHANNTSATANMTDQVFRDTSGTYSSTITWTGTTAPSGTTNHSFRFTRIGNQVTANIHLNYGTAGSTLTAVQMALPASFPTPAEPAGLGAASEMLYPAFGYLNTGNTVPSSTPRAALRVNPSDNGYELYIVGGSGNYKTAWISVTYYTN